MSPSNSPVPDRYDDAKKLVRDAIEAAELQVAELGETSRYRTVLVEELKHLQDMLGELGSRTLSSKHVEDDICYPLIDSFPREGPLAQVKAKIIAAFDAYEAIRLG